MAVNTLDTWRTRAACRGPETALFFPPAAPLVHWDRFFLPAISRVDYRFSADRHFIITSQCTPVAG